MAKNAHLTFDERQTIEVSLREKENLFVKMQSLTSSIWRENMALNRVCKK